LRHAFGLEAEARAIETAIGRTLADGLRTADLGLGADRPSGTTGMAAAIVSALETPNAAAAVS
jgi:3-isopropylmalate dehydrogenase